MDTAIYLIKSVVQAIFASVMIAMLIRSLMSLFMLDDNKFANVVFYITEPFIVPVRILLEKLNLFQATPIDFSFMITVLLLGIVSMFL